MAATSLLVSLCLSCLLLPVSVLLITSLIGGLVVSYYYWDKQPLSVDSEGFERYYNELLTLLKAAVLLLTVIPFLVVKFVFLSLSLIICIKRYSVRRVRSRNYHGERDSLISTPITSYTT